MGLDEQIADLQAQIDGIRGLKRSAAFVWFLEQIKQNFEAKRMELMKPPTEIVDEQARTYIAGEARALFFCLGHVDTAMQGLWSSLRALEARAERIANETEGDV